MNEDEQFAASLRPASVFGSLGESDYEDDQISEDDYDDGLDPEYFDDVPSHVHHHRPSQHVQEPLMAFHGPLASTTTASTGAAITLFCLLGGGLLGWKYGGAKGAAGGAVIGGALRNLYRTHRTIQAGGDAGTAVKQGVLGAVGLAGGGYLLWSSK